MAIWWIKNKDVPMYMDLMHRNGHEGRILQTRGACSQVEFAQDVLNTWAQCGYWFGGSPNLFYRWFQSLFLLFKPRSQ